MAPKKGNGALKRNFARSWKPPSKPVDPADILDFSEAMATTSDESGSLSSMMPPPPPPNVGLPEKKRSHLTEQMLKAPGGIKTMTRRPQLVDLNTTNTRQRALHSAAGNTQQGKTAATGDLLEGLDSSAEISLTGFLPKKPQEKVVRKRSTLSRDAFAAGKKVGFGRPTKYNAVGPTNDKSLNHSGNGNSSLSEIADSLASENDHTKSGTSKDGEIADVDVVAHEQEPGNEREVVIENAQHVTKNKENLSSSGGGLRRSGRKAGSSGSKKRSQLASTECAADTEENNAASGNQPAVTVESSRKRHKANDGDAAGQGDIETEKRGASAAAGNDNIIKKLYFTSACSETDNTTAVSRRANHRTASVTSQYNNTTDNTTRRISSYGSRDDEGTVNVQLPMVTDVDVSEVSQVISVIADESHAGDESRECAEPVEENENRESEQGGKQEKHVDGLTDQSNTQPTTGKSDKSGTSDQSAKQSTTGKSNKSGTSDQSAKQSTTGKSNKSAIIDQSAKQSTTGKSDKSGTSDQSAKQSTTGKSNKSASSDQSAKQSTTGQSNKSATSDQSAKQSTTGQSNKSATSDQSAKKSTTGKSHKSASVNQSAKHSTTGKSGKSTTIGQSGKQSTTGSGCGSRAVHLQGEHSTASHSNHQPASRPSDDQYGAGPSTSNTIPETADSAMQSPVSVQSAVPSPCSGVRAIVHSKTPDRSTSAHTKSATPVRSSSGKADRSSGIRKQAILNSPKKRRHAKTSTPSPVAGGQRNNTSLSPVSGRRSSGKMDRSATIRKQAIMNSHKKRRREVPQMSLSDVVRPDVESDINTMDISSVMTDSVINSPVVPGRVHGEAIRFTPTKQHFYKQLKHKGIPEEYHSEAWRLNQDVLMDKSAPGGRAHNRYPIRTRMPRVDQRTRTIKGYEKLQDIELHYSPNKNEQGRIVGLWRSLTGMELPTEVKGDRLKTKKEPKKRGAAAAAGEACNVSAVLPLTVLDHHTNTEHMRDCVWKYNEDVFVQYGSSSSPDSPASPAPAPHIAHTLDVFKGRVLNYSGSFMIPPTGAKPEEVADSDISFSIQTGTVSVSIHKSDPVKLGSKDQFCVPKGNVYNIRNVGKSKAVLAMYVFRDADDSGQAGGLIDSLTD